MILAFAGALVTVTFGALPSAPVAPARRSS
jgi:hypothetical protein